MKAMLYAMEMHKDQVRRYTGTPYFEHLAEVAGIVAGAKLPNYAVEVAWLHDVVEDTEVTVEDIHTKFGSNIAYGVSMLTDSTIGNRKARKELDRIRLSHGESWVQDIKLADIISNTKSIFKFDKDFAKVYRHECLDMIAMLGKCSPELKAIALEMLQ